MTESRVLLTGFEPFGGYPTNPSLQVAQALRGREGWLVDILPVDFARCVPRIQELVRRHRPRIVLSLGLAPGRERLELERVAVNLIDARIPDNTGAQPVDIPVIEQGPDAYFSTLPVKAMRRAIEETGVAAGLSLSAGTYGCNAVMYAALHAAATAQQPTTAQPPTTATRAGFIHVPQAQVLAVPDATHAVVTAVECALHTPVDDAVPDGTIA